MDGERLAAYGLDSRPSLEGDASILTSRVALPRARRETKQINERRPRSRPEVDMAFAKSTALPTELIRIGELGLAEFQL